MKKITKRRPSNFYHLPKILLVIKSKSACNTHVEEKIRTTFYSEILKIKNHFAELSIDGTMILKYSFEKHGVIFWTRLVWLSIGFSGNFPEHMSYCSRFIKDKLFLNR
jgi:hypothetical protein